MTIEEAVYDFLSNLAAFTATLGDDGAGPSLYPKRLVQEPVLPAVVFQVVSGVPAYTMDQAGDPPTQTSYVRNRIQFDLWADSYEALLPVKTALFNGISGFRGMMGTMMIESVFVVNEVDTFEPDAGSNRKIVDAIFSYEG